MLESLGDGLFWLSGMEKGFYDGRYYNLDGECVIDFPQYREKQRPYLCGPFVDGYAWMDITGADGKNYITVIDTIGSFMFEPKSGFGEGTWNSFGTAMQNNGKYLVVCTDDCIMVLNINGDIVYSIECV